MTPVSSLRQGLLDVSDHSASKPSKFDPNSATVTSSADLKKHLRGLRIGYGDGYTSLFHAASNSTFDQDNIMILRILIGMMLLLILFIQLTKM